METLKAVTEWMASHWWILALVVFLAAYKWTFRLFGVVVIAEDAISGAVAPAAPPMTMFCGVRGLSHTVYTPT